MVRPKQGKDREKFSVWLQQYDNHSITTLLSGLITTLLSGLSPPCYPDTLKKKE